MGFVVFVLTIAAVAVRSLAANHIEEQSKINNTANLPTNDNERMLKEETDLVIREKRAGYSLSSATCESVGGKCLPKKKCKGKTAGRFQCRNSKTICCITGCPLDKGFFRTPYPYNQCFTLIDKIGTWEDGNNTCHERGLVLAKPLETIALKNYLVMRYGEFDDSKEKGAQRVTAWLDAVADGTCMRWNRGPYGCISPHIPIWWPGNPRVEVGKCLLLTSNPHDWMTNPEKSLYSLPCDWATRYPLCELTEIMEIPY